MPNDRRLEGVQLLRRRQLAVQQQIADFDEIRLGGELLDRVAAVQKYAFLAIDEGDLAIATARRNKAGIVGEYSLLLVKTADVYDVGSERALANRQLHFGRTVRRDQRVCIVGHFFPRKMGAGSPQRALCRRGRWTG